MTDQPTPVEAPRTESFRFDCTFCGQNIDGKELHTYVHCVLHKAGIDPLDYGLVLVKLSDWEEAS